MTVMGVFSFFVRQTRPVLKNSMFPLAPGGLSGTRRDRPVSEI